MFVILGVLGLFLPLLQGVLFLVIGLTLLSTRYAFARSLLNRARQRYPKEYERMHALRDRIIHSKPLILTGLTVLVGLCVFGVYTLIALAKNLSAHIQ